MKESAGTLLYRQSRSTVEVLIVHPSGHYNRGAPWSIPKGKPEPGEDLEAAARRETREETGVLAGDLKPIGSIELTRSRKRVHGFAGPAPEPAVPRCASWEVDGVQFVPIEKARDMLHPAQEPFLDRLLEILTDHS